MVPTGPIRRWFLKRIEKKFSRLKYRQNESSKVFFTYNCKGYLKISRKNRLLYGLWNHYYVFI